MVKFLIKEIGNCHYRQALQHSKSKRQSIFVIKSPKVFFCKSKKFVLIEVWFSKSNYRPTAKHVFFYITAVCKTSMLHRFGRFCLLIFNDFWTGHFRNGGTVLHLQLWLLLLIEELFDLCSVIWFKEVLNTGRSRCWFSGTLIDIITNCLN